MSATILNFIGSRPRDDGMPRAQALAERLAAAMANENPVDCADALARLLAAICCVNAINLTEAVETAQLIGLDIEELTRGMMAPDAPVLPPCDTEPA